MSKEFEKAVRNMIRSLWTDENLNGGLLSRETLLEVQRLEHLLNEQKVDEGEG